MEVVSKMYCKLIFLTKQNTLDKSSSFPDDSGPLVWLKYSDALGDGCGTKDPVANTYCLRQLGISS